MNLKLPVSNLQCARQKKVLKICIVFENVFHQAVMQIFINMMRYVDNTCVGGVTDAHQTYVSEKKEIWAPSTSFNLSIILSIKNSF